MGQRGKEHASQIQSTSNFELTETRPAFGTPDKAIYYGRGPHQE